MSLWHPQRHTGKGGGDLLKYTSQLQPNTFKLLICKIMIDVIEVDTWHTCHGDKIDIAIRERESFTLWLGDMCNIRWTTVNV